MAPDTTAASVLLIEDDPDMAAIVTRSIETDGLAVTWTATGTDGIERARTGRFDLVVLDIGLPDIDGTDVCRRLRTFTDAYVIMLTARGSEVDRIVGLSAGADDYVVKPFSPAELVLRIRAMLRRGRGADSSQAGPDGASTPAGVTVNVGDLRLNEAAREVHVGGEPVSLTRLEFDLLAVLVRERNVVLGRDRLVELVWGPDWFGDTHLVDVHISNLRRKLGDDSKAPMFIRSVRGVGFRLGTCTRDDRGA